MRKIYSLFPLILLLTSCLIYIPVPYEEGPYQDEGYYEETYYDVYDWSISNFYDYLSPHGYWVYHSPYGYVWLPRIDRYGWRPYTYGHWAWTDYGWTWASRFEWGWIPFHYGRWGWSERLGWFWVPDTIWSPAWVVWRTSSLHIGWAPLPPDVLFIRGIGIQALPYSLYDHYWIFVSSYYFYDDYLYRRILPTERNRTIISISSLRAKIYEKNGRIVNEGLVLEDVEKALKKRITKVSLKDAEQPGKTRIRMDNVTIFRPEIQKDPEAKPRLVFEQEQAKEEIERYRMKKRADDEDVDSQLTEQQENEARLLEESQKKELEEIKLRWESEKQIRSGDDEKKASGEDYRIAVDKLKKKHSAEKVEMGNRHSTEKKKVKKKDDKDK